jgi:hypothetical protein
VATVPRVSLCVRGSVAGGWWLLNSFFLVFRYLFTVIVPAVLLVPCGVCVIRARMGEVHHVGPFPVGMVNWVHLRVSDQGSVGLGRVPSMERL